MTKLLQKKEWLFFQILVSFSLFKLGPPQKPLQGMEVHETEEGAIH